jgi:hypothetical protein
MNVIFAPKHQSRIKNYFLLLGVLFLSFIAHTQSFPDTREKFVKEYPKLMSVSATNDEMDFVKRKLTPSLIEGSTFSDAYFKKMVETANLMESKKIKYYPEIYNYVFSVYSFVNNKQSQESFNSWHTSVDNMLDAKNVTKFKDFIEFSATFFSEGILTNSANFSWMYQGGKYTFEYTDQPFIKFEGGSLKCVVEKTKNRKNYIDSIVVYKTSGTYFPNGKNWTGKGGNIDWQKVGLAKENTSATLKSFAINMRTPTLKVDTVSLTTPFFSKPILGLLNDRAFSINRDEDRIYPQFNSFEGKLTIQNITEGIKYSGGFSLKGRDFVGVGSLGEPAVLTITKGGKNFIKVQSQLVIVSPTKVFTPLGQATIYLSHKDSIYHPGVDFNYYIENKTAEFTRGKTGISQSPFTDSYHNLDIYAPKIAWEKEDSKIYLTYGIEIGKEVQVTRLESKNYFDARLYDQLQGFESVHPLVLISNYCYKYDEYLITEGKLATALGKTIEQAKPLMLQLSGLGFISYDTDSKVVVVNEKTMNFVAAKSGKKDFDNLSFISDLRVKVLPTTITQEEISKNKSLQIRDSMFRSINNIRGKMKNFGVLDLVSLEINLEAVDRVVISDYHNTAVFPEENKITISNDRNFTFKGWMNSGKLEIKTDIANYDYAKNKVNLIKTQKGIFRVRPLSPNDGVDNISLKSALSGVIGEIILDAPNNRSGNNKKITDFPKLIVSNNSKVYYDDYSLYRGSYDSTRFYFTIEPFQLDSLGTFKEKSLRMNGELVSAGIFPKFKEELKIMPDYSFGFSRVAPVGGYDFYTTKAKYDNKIILSGNGLQGEGKIDFVQSTSTSKAFTFLPDSTVGYAQFVNKPVEAGTQFPDIECKNAYISYIPKGNILRASSTESLLVFFKDEGKLNGTAIVSPKGITGNGIMNLKEANLRSDNFKFQRWEVNADTSNFNLKNKYQQEDEEQLSFKTENVTARVSFSERKGVFTSNKGESKVEFPVNQYFCKMDMFTWMMDSEIINMENTGKSNIDIDAGLDLSKPNFFSMHPKQDSLQFKSAKATFSFKDRAIYCSNVEYIDVADARIYPDEKKLTILKKAFMTPLANSVIVANYITKYHTFTNASTVITARRAYTSSGDYPYYGADSVKFTIKMDKIGLDPSFQTISSGKISDADGFKLSKQFDYYGAVNIQATNPTITFTGATRINHSCDKFPRSWMAFSSEIDPKNIQIPVSNSMKTLEGIPISAGIVWRDSRDADSVKLYPTFLSTLESAKDPILITASGLLQYNAQAKEFQIGSAEKLANRSEKGNFIALHIESCSMNGEGAIDLGMNYGSVTVDAIGVANYNQANGLTTLNLTARFNFPVNEGVFERVGSKIAANEELRALDFNSSTLSQAITEWKDQKTAESIKNEFIQKGEVRRLPKEFEQSIVITGIRLKSYNQNQASGLITTSETASLVNMYGKPVFKQVPLKAFFKQVYSDNVSGDRLNLFMSVPGGADYFFDYGMTKNDGLLKIYTGDADLNNAVNEIKEDKRKSKNFKYEISTNSGLMSIFKQLFE